VHFWLDNGRRVHQQLEDQMTTEMQAGALAPVAAGGRAFYARVLARESSGWFGLAPLDLPDRTSNPTQSDISDHWAHQGDPLQLCRIPARRPPTISWTTEAFVRCRSDSMVSPA
jgi:hypothetical protein